MTKAKIEKEAEEYVGSKSCDTDDYSCGFLPSTVEEMLIEFAEPREKQIQIDAEQIRALQKQNGELTDKVRELENAIEGYKNQIFYKEKALAKVKKEKDRIVHRVTKDKKRLIRRNTEYKAQIEKMKCCANCRHSRTKYEHCRTDKYEKWEIKENE